MDTKKLKKFIEVQELLEVVKERYENARLAIMSDMQKEKLEKAETEYGTFTRAKRTTWVYTDKVVALEEKVKVAKVKEQQQGKATENVSEHLRYTPVKN